MKIEHLYGNKLLDQYEKMLTPRQFLILNDYYRNDLSLQEIATNEGISKAAVNDLINRSLKLMLNYEDKLKLVKKSLAFQEIYNEYSKNNNLEICHLLEKIRRIEEE